MSSPLCTASILTKETPYVCFSCGDFDAVYLLDVTSGAVEFGLIPACMEMRRVAPREVLDTPEIQVLPDSMKPVPARRGLASLVQLKLIEDNQTGGFTGGRSMRANTSVALLCFQSQAVTSFGDGAFRVRTTMSGGRGYRCVHVLQYAVGDEGVRVHVEFTNFESIPLTLEMLSSFCLGGLSPFDGEDSVGRLRLHRFRSSWSAEGRHEAVDFEDLHLERSWMNASVVNERFGQVGSMPVRVWFPFVAVEDKEVGVIWAVQLACGSSWQMEVYRWDDKVSVSGGLADREFGHWMKSVAPGETFTTPAACLTAGLGDIDVVSQRLVRMQEKALMELPTQEEEMPVIFNEWCSSWGLPTPEFIQATAARLKDSPVKVFVIDDGWAEKPDGVGQFNGDWNVEKRRFPHGLKPVADELRAMGYTPGLWFEFEVCTEGTEAFALDDHKLRRDGRTLQVGTRHFWDFTDPWTFDYLRHKVIDRLRDDGFGYLKVDYNDTLGIGCDYVDSPGEGLRRHIEGVRRFFRMLREELPELIIEVCSSGGHRLEPSFMELSSMGSFSDAHECPEIPIIAANLHRLILPRQNQIWAVLHKQDTLQRLHYSLAATFLGRACLSGDIVSLGNEAFALVLDDLGFYERVRHVIRDGESRIRRSLDKSWRRPRGWQAVTRLSRPYGDEMLVVAHAFGESRGEVIALDLSPAEWVLAEQRGIGIVWMPTGCLRVDADFSAIVLHLRRR